MSSELPVDPGFLSGVRRERRGGPTERRGGCCAQGRAWGPHRGAVVLEEEGALVELELPLAR